MAITFAAPAVVAAQTVVVRVVEDSTRQVLPGVVVRLLSGERVVAAGLTRESGRVTLVAPATGRYELTASRIGYEGFGPLTIEVRDGTQAREIVMPRGVRQLPPLVVTRETRCDRTPGRGTTAAALWEDVRTALQANELTAREGRVPLRVVRFEQDLSPERAFLRERVIRRFETHGQPFVAEDPEELRARGFVYRLRDTVHYAAPDASLLLTDAFVNEHCFSVRDDGPVGARLGLAFAPVPGRSLPDVSGTLWIDAASRELRFLDFTYTGLDRELGLGGPGGRVEFARLSDGSWIVRDWSLTMPVVGRQRPVGQPEAAAERYRLLGWLVAGGRAAPVSSPEVSRAEVVSVVHGVAFDSLEGGPLVGALATLDGEPDSAITDQGGRFTLAVRGAGPRVLRLLHARLGVVSDNSTQDITLHPARAMEARVAVPPIQRFVRTLCGEEAGATGVLGLARDARGEPVEGVSVRVTWVQPAPRRQFLRRELETRSGARGLYTFCALPEATVTLHLGERTRSVELRRGTFAWVELSARP